MSEDIFTQTNTPVPEPAPINPRPNARRCLRLSPSARKRFSAMTPMESEKPPGH